ncbi:hypothetical protein EAS64_39740 [Trebonia kvetii]|uniref:DUF2637 domain-containing protein n=2 Tax=Trebonia kvetii TaxID=2480626 RepID=A0A6P2BNT6_9ACTN|nr:hypothetical protein EAS64_39740 [Trebonia kvetii]
MTAVMPVAQPDQAALPESAANSGATGAFTVPHAGPGRDRPGLWLHAASFGLCVLAGAAAAVSFSAQYRLVYVARHLRVVAGLEAAIPDAAALVFACLGVALALNGRRAVRARALNAASAGASVFMNVIAAAPGWRDLAVWAMPPAAYALASDTLIGVVRAWVLARRQDPAVLAEASLLVAAAGLALWLLRLSLAPASTLTGFRTWVVEECPVAPGRRAILPNPAAGAVLPGSHAPAGQPSAAARSGRVSLPSTPSRNADRQRRGSGRGGTKTARFLALVTERHGPLAGIPLPSVGRICAELAPAADLNTGSARSALRRAVLTAQNGDHS